MTSLNAVLLTRSGRETLALHTFFILEELESRAGKTKNVTLGGGSTGQGAVLLETWDWDGLSERVMEDSYSASRSLRTAVI